MNKSFFGCTYTDVWASPQNWETTTSKKALNEDWYVQCVFHDPKFPDKEPKGFQCRRRQNKWTTIGERREAIRIAWEEMETVLKKGYNPITRQFMVPQDAPQSDSILHITRNSDLITALNFANSLHTCNSDTKKDIKSMLGYFKKSCEILKLDTLQIHFVRGYHIRQIMDNVVNIKEVFTEAQVNNGKGFVSNTFRVNPNFVKYFRESASSMMLYLMILILKSPAGIITDGVSVFVTLTVTLPAAETHAV